MPYPNEHACRLRQPGDFEPDSFRRMSREHEGKKYDVIMGKLKGENGMTEQAYRYSLDEWSEDDAQVHCKGHDGVTFEAAVGETEKATKAGRVLSRASITLISQAITPLLELLESVGVDVPGWGRTLGEDDEEGMESMKGFEEMSFEERERVVRNAWHAAYRVGQGPLACNEEWIWVRVYADYVIAEMKDGLWQYPYTVDMDGKITFGEGVKVEVSYTAAKSSNSLKSLLDSMWLVAHGGTIKALGDGRVGGYLVRFSTDADPDLVNQFFNKKTDFDFDFPGQSSVYFHHGLDPTIKKRRLCGGKRATLTQDEFGVWVEAQLDLRDRYEKFIYDRCQAGKMGWSSGTAPNLVSVQPAGKSEWIATWPLGLDASITPTPAEPRAGVQTLKSYAMASKAVDFSLVEQETAEGPESEGEGGKADEIRKRLSELKNKRGK